MIKTNIDLVAHAEKALIEKWHYGWGSYGQIATETLVNSLVNQYPSMNTRWKNYMLGAVSARTRLCDCYGLVKGFIWWTSDTGNPKYNSAQDRNTAGAYNAAKEKGKLDTLPEVPGVILYMEGHVGVYCGKGRFIELQGGGVGAYEGKIENKKIVKGSKFTHWFKDINIEYIEGGLTMDQYNELKSIIDAQQKEIDALKNPKKYNTIDEVPSWCKDDINHLIKIGAFADEKKLDLTYDQLRLYSSNYRIGIYNNIPEKK